MVETQPGDMTRTYAYSWLLSPTLKWANFAVWCEAQAQTALPSAPSLVVEYLQEKAGEGARPSTLRVTAAAIARRHSIEGLANPYDSPEVQGVLEESTEDTAPGPRRVLPLDMNCYRAIRETAYEPRRTRGGRFETQETAHQRGALDVAMIGLMRDAQLLVREAADLRWADIEQLPDGTGTVTVRHPQSGAVDRRTVSSSTMMALAALERSGELALNLRPNRIGIRISQATAQAGLGEGFGGESPRMGMAADLESLAVELLGEFSEVGSR